MYRRNSELEHYISITGDTANLAFGDILLFTV